jgi:hypothetical protein
MKIRGLSIVLLTLAVFGISACNKQEAAAPAEAPAAEAPAAEAPAVEGAMEGDAATSGAEAPAAGEAPAQ